MLRSSNMSGKGEGGSIGGGGGISSTIIILESINNMVDCSWVKASNSGTVRYSRGRPGGSVGNFETF